MPHIDAPAANGRFLHAAKLHERAAKDAASANWIPVYCCRRHHRKNDYGAAARTRTLLAEIASGLLVEQDALDGFADVAAVEHIGNIGSGTTNRPYRRRAPL
jgi:triosephosphate isomerase